MLGLFLTIVTLQEPEKMHQFIKYVVYIELGPLRQNHHDQFNNILE